MTDLTQDNDAIIELDSHDDWINEFQPEFVIECLKPFVSEQRMERIDSVLANRLSSVTVVLDNPHDPHNGAAVLRSLEAHGINQIHVVESTKRFRMSSAVTIGCEKWMSMHRYNDFSQVANRLHDQGMRLWAAMPSAETTIQQIDLSEPVALIFGNEHTGLSDKEVALCDDTFTIPMYGFTESFNLSVSVALSVYEVATSRRKILGTKGDISVLENRTLCARWIAQDIRGAEHIVRDKFTSKS